MILMNRFPYFRRTENFDKNRYSNKHLFVSSVLSYRFGLQAFQGMPNVDVRKNKLYVIKKAQVFIRINMESSNE